jgi:hypothetical protein
MAEAGQSGVGMAVPPQTPRARRVVLAYSGGVDTSVCIPYLRNEWGVEEVITFAADLGQGDELEPIRLKALDSGASRSIVGDLIDHRVCLPRHPCQRPLRGSLSALHGPGPPPHRPTPGGGGPRAGRRCGGPRLHRQGQ